MTATLDLACVVICPAGVVGSIRSLVDRLSSSNVVVKTVDEVAEAAELVLGTASPLAVLIDMRNLATDDPQDMREATEILRRTRAMMPTHRPIVVVAGATNSFLVAVFRAGAGDIIDLSLEGTTHARAVVMRASTHIVEQQQQRAGSNALRRLLDDFLRELIVTERRKIDLEEKLAGLHNQASRNPVVLVVEDDKAVADRLTESLEQQNITAYSYLSGEDAVHAMLGVDDEDISFDLALVDMSLPGMDGLETITQLQQATAELPCFLMATEAQRDRLATSDVEIVGFVMKPFENFSALTTKIGTFARESMNRNREQAYLKRIKARHAELLDKFRQVVG